MWPVLLNKAYAKIHGNYQVSRAGYAENALRFLTGFPVFTYAIAQTTTEFKQTKWPFIHKYFKMGFPITLEAS